MMMTLTTHRCEKTMRQKKKRKKICLMLVRMIPVYCRFVYCLPFQKLGYLSYASDRVVSKLFASANRSILLMFPSVGPFGRPTNQRDSQSVIHSISYWSRHPDHHLLTLVGEGRFSNPSVLTTVAERCS